MAGPQFPHRRDGLNHAVVLGGYLALTLALTFPLALQFARAIPGDSFDGWQNYWNLWWVRVALLDQHSLPYFTNLLYHPTGVSLLFHTLNPFNGLLSLPVQLSAGLLVAYNSIVLFSFVLAGYGAYLLARQVLGRQANTIPAFAAGVIYTFAPVHVAHLLGHMQVISLEWIPFFALYLLRLRTAVENASPNRDAAHQAAMAVLFLAMVALCDWYFVLYCLIFSVLVLLWSAWWSWRARRGLRSSFVRGAPAVAAQPGGGAGGWLRQVSAFAIVWVCWALLMAPLLVPMIREARHSRYMVPDPAQSRIFSADLLAFVIPQEFHPLWGRWARTLAASFPATVSEHQVFTGFAVVLLAGFAFWASRRTGPWRTKLGPWPLTALCFSVLALGPVLHVAGRADLLPGGGEVPLPYGWLSRIVPFLDITRSLSRFDVMVMLSFAILAAIGMQWLIRRSRRPVWIGVALCGLIVFEFLPAPYPMSPPDTPDWYRTLAADPRGGAVLNLPMNWDRPGYLLYQTVHHRPLAVAYISREDPRTLVERAPVLQNFRHLGSDVIDLDLAAQGEQVLGDLGIRWVVLDRYKMPGGTERAYNEATARQIFADRTPAYQDGRLTVYEVLPAAAQAPYLVLGAGWSAFDPAEHTRALNGSATLIAQAPQAGEVTIRVGLATGSPPLDLPLAGDQYVMQLHLQPGANPVTLHAVQPDSRVVVTSLTVAPR